MENSWNKLGLISLIISSITLVLVVVLSVFFFVDLSKRNNTNYSQFRLYIGTNDKDTYEPMDQEVARNKVDNICTSYFSNGYTLQEAIGSWKDESGEITHEYTLVCNVTGVDINTIHKASDEMIVQLNQSSILIESYSAPVEFYSGANA